MPWQALPFARSSKRKQKCILLVKTVSIKQRNVGFLPNATDGSLKVLFYHRQGVNALLLTIFFLLPSAWLYLRLPIHVGSLEGSNLSPANSKLFTALHILFFADVGDRLEVGFVGFFGFVFHCFYVYTR